MVPLVVLLVRAHFLTTWFVQTPTCPSLSTLRLRPDFRISDFGFFGSLLRSFLRSFVPSFVLRRFVPSFVRSSVRSSIRSFVRPSVRLFVRCSVLVALCCALSRCRVVRCMAPCLQLPPLPRRRQTTAMTSSPRCCGVSSMRAHRLR